MSWNGLGTFGTLSYPNFPAVPGSTIKAAEFNAVIRDIATGLSNCLARDGQSLPMTNLPMNGLKHTGVAKATVATDYARFDQVVQLDSPTSVALMAIGTTDQRPASPLDGHMRINTTVNGVEFYRSGAWVTITAGTTIDTSLLANKNGSNAIGTWGISISGTAASAAYATNAGTAASVPYTGITGNLFTLTAGEAVQPAWLWGFNGAPTYQLWDPRNFHVAYADSAGSAATAADSSKLGGVAASGYALASHAHASYVAVSSNPVTDVLVVPYGVDGLKLRVVHLNGSTLDTIIKADSGGSGGG